MSISEMEGMRPEIQGGSSRVVGLVTERELEALRIRGPLDCELPSWPGTASPQGYCKCRTTWQPPRERLKC